MKLFSLIYIKAYIQSKHKQSINQAIIYMTDLIIEIGNYK